MDIPDYFPIYARSEEDIRESFDYEANRDLTPEDADWVDTRPGSPFYLATQPAVTALAALYDRMNETLAAAILATSWGSSLDLIAWGYGQTRIAAVQATGDVAFLGTDGTLIGTGVKVSPQQTDPDVVPPVFETVESGTISGGSLTLGVRAIEAGADGNVAAASITYLQSSVPGVASVTNPLATRDGAEEETDAQLKERLTLYFDGKGSGTRADYKRWALSRPGVGRVQVVRAWDGPGTVKVILMDASGDPVSAGVVADVQAFLDPIPGQGAGQAPVDHEVTASTPSVTQVFVKSGFVFEEGYSLDGADGTVSLAVPLERVVSDYVDALNAGEDVVYNHVLGQFFKVAGVLNATNLKLDVTDPPTGTSDVSVDTDHVAQLGGVEWT